MTLIEERYELVKERLQDMLTEQAVSEKYTEYFHQMAERLAGQGIPTGAESS